VTSFDIKFHDSFLLLWHPVPKVHQLNPEGTSTLIFTFFPSQTHIIIWLIYNSFPMKIVASIIFIVYHTTGQQHQCVTGTGSTDRLPKVLEVHAAVAPHRGPETAKGHSLVESHDYWELVTKWVWFESLICREWLQGQLVKFWASKPKGTGNLRDP